MRVAGVETHFLREGKGSPVVLLHGLGASSYSWRHTIPALAESHEVFAPDLPGFGRTEKPYDFDYSLTGLAAWVAGFLDAMGIAHCDLVGNSMGGATALVLAQDRPERTRKLALIGTPFSAKNKPWLLWPMRWPVVGGLYERALGPWAVPLVARAAFVDWKVIDRRMCEEYGHALKESGGRRAVAQFIRNAIPSDAEQRVARFKDLPNPVLVIRGEHDLVVDRAVSERFCREAKDARFLHLPGLGHAPHEERPEQVNPVLAEFLA